MPAGISPSSNFVHEPKIKLDWIVLGVYSNVGGIEAVVREAEGMKVLNTSAYAVHTNRDI